MHFEYVGKTRDMLNHVLGGTVEFEDQIKLASKGDEVDQVAVHPLTPGLSGAAVFLIRRIGPHGRLIPWVGKVCDTPALIIAERDINQTHVQGRMAAAPSLIFTGSSKVLLFRFGGALADYSPRTVRSGYAMSSPNALAALMRRIVASLSAMHDFSDDGMSYLDRMPLLNNLEEQLEALSPTLSKDVASRLRDRWSDVLSKKDRFPRIRSTAHGDLNTGNVLFEPGVDASQPVFIDFASVGRSKDNEAYPPFSHHPFWDYAKFERDIQTRLFLKEAVEAGLAADAIVDVIQALDGVSHRPTSTSGPASKLFETTWALRHAVRQRHSPEDFAGCYRTVMAYAMLTVLFRTPPDDDVSHQLQCLVAAEAGIALLENPLSAFPNVELDFTSASSDTITSSSIMSSSRLTGDETELIGHLFRYKGLCRISAAMGEYESLWCPGEMCDMQWGWERTPEEAAEAHKTRGDRVERLRWLSVVSDLVEKDLLKQLEKKKGQRSKYYQLTEAGWKAGGTIAARSQKG